MFFTELEETSSQYEYFHSKYTNTRKPLIAKTILRKKNANGGINLPYFRIYSKLVLKTIAQKQKSRSMEQNRKPRSKSTHLWTS